MATSMDSLVENGQEMSNAHSDSLDSFTKIEEQIKIEDDEEKSSLLGNEGGSKQDKEVFLLHKNEDKKAMSSESSVDDWDSVKKNGMDEPKRKTHTETPAYQQQQQPSPIRENKGSLLRRQMAQHKSSTMTLSGDDYMTPSQRKDELIKELRLQLKLSQKRAEEREEEILTSDRKRAESIAEVEDVLGREIETIKVSHTQLQEKYDQLLTVYEETLRKKKDIEKLVKEMRIAQEENEKLHQKLYYEMYRKGQMSVEFERQVELEQLAQKEPNKVSVDELLDKLKLTESELTKWQCYKRTESYAEGEKPDTEAEARLRFLRDSMYHFLTDNDRKDSEQHLKAVVGILSYTDVQMKRITKAISDRKKGK
ncbi:DgyrCDS8578 [Dimorphilus gyrociliatus]|uniref:DgyrCDS8578 n=1 Tax=Dimorphilus gyrociliatus TaxID=2664684 RepID=A0A7I8VW92_9ANNE|nr:DgyrCDS8578 [Dimorphilus gyrociliatus]